VNTSERGGEMERAKEEECGQFTLYTEEHRTIKLEIIF
jgi:hypothetical protein